MWTDSETDTDFLNFTGVAKTVAEMIRQVQPKPVSIGVSGAWGTGKSSLIKLVRNELQLDSSKPRGTLSDPNRFLFVEFNAWLYQGYDDARAALLEAVARALQQEAQSRKTAFDKVKDFAERVNWFRAIKLMGSSGLIAAHVSHPWLAILASLGLVTVGSKDSQSAGTAPAKAEKNGNESGGKDDPWLKAAASETPPKEIQALRNALEEALRELNSTLVVLIDDLDRCLPETTISTLEAIRLLLFMDHAAFVIAADESMIKHAVKRHFEGVDDTLVTNYFDKLIQVPIRVPQLGVQEVRAYMMLLYIEAGRLDETEREELRRKICERLGRTWRGERVDAAFVKGLRPHWPDSLESQLDTADRLAVLMTNAKEIAGNPRLIKRFLNALSLRLSLAKAQGVSVDEAVLTKLLLFERCGSPDAYEALIRSVTEDPEGKPTVIAGMEEQVRKSEGGEFEKPWDGTFMRDWFALDPTLGDRDLRGALYVSREHAPLILPENRLSQAAAQLLEGLASQPDMADSVKAQIAALDPRSRATILDKLLDLARKEQEWGAPKILTACAAVAREDPQLGRQLSGFLKERPASQIKPSIVPKIAAEPWSGEVFSVWLAQEEVSPPVKAAIRQRTEKKK